MEESKSKDAIEQLEQSLLTIGLLTSELIRNMELYDAILKELSDLKNFNVSVDHNPVPVSIVIKALILDKVLLVGSSIIEEADKFLSVKKMPAWKLEIEQFKSKVGPIKRRIDQWSDLRQFRNQILAHNLRKKNGASILDLKNGKHEFNAPKSNGEVVIFFELIRAYTELLFMHFREYQSSLNLTLTLADCIHKISKDLDFIAELRWIENFRISSGMSPHMQALDNTPADIQNLEDYFAMAAYFKEKYAL